MLAPNWLGDMVMALPAMAAVRAGMGGRSVVVARSATAEIAEVVADEVWLTGRSAMSTAQLVLRLRARRPDMVVSFLRSRRAGLIARGSGAPTRVGWDSGPARRAYTLRAPSARKAIHQSEEYLSLPRAMGLPAPGVFPARELFVRTPGGPPRIVMAPAASFGPAKRWPAPHFAALARALRETTGLPVVLVGSRAETAHLDEIARMAKEGVENLAGRTTVRELAAVLASARVFVGNDSGTAHLAAWMGAPVVVIFGSTSPRWTAPVGGRVRVVYRNESCSPCFRRVCPFGHTHCLALIDPREVLAACTDVLGQARPNPEEELSRE